MDKAILNEIYTDFINNGDHVIGIQRGGYVVGKVDSEHLYITKQQLENMIKDRFERYIHDHIPEYLPVTYQNANGWNACVDEFKRLAKEDEDD